MNEEEKLLKSNTMLSFKELSYPDAPKIVVKPPGPKASDIIKKVNQYVPTQIYIPGKRYFPPAVWESARGSTVRDVDGNIFIDFTAGWHATNTGHSHPKVIQAIKEATEKFLNTACWPFELRYEAARKVIEIAPKGLNRTYFKASGSLAVQEACKLARLFTKKTDIISLHHHWHGVGYLASHISPGNHVKDFGPLAGGVLHAPTSYCYRCSFRQEYPKCDLLCANYIEEVIKTESVNNVAAVILEPWARYGGTPDGYLARLKKICEENEVLFIADEITCGFGRTGKWWACDWEKVTPDILLTAKGLSSGFPNAAVIASEKMTKQLPEMSQATSFSMNPVACAAVSVTIDVAKEMNIVQNAALVGDYMKKRLLEMKEDHNLIGNVAAKGLNIRLDLVKDRKTKKPAVEETGKVFRRAFEKGLLTYGGEWWTPPLVLTKDLAGKGLDILEESLKRVERELR